MSCLKCESEQSKDVYLEYGYVGHGVMEFRTYCLCASCAVQAGFCLICHNLEDDERKHVAKHGICESCYLEFDLGNGEP